MKITESQLRKVIKQIIKENDVIANDEFGGAICRSCMKPIQGWRDYGRGGMCVQCAGSEEVTYAQSTPEEKPITNKPFDMSKNYYDHEDALEFRKKWANRTK